MHPVICLLGACAASALGGDIVIPASDAKAVQHSPGFALAESPYTLGGRHLVARSPGAGSPPSSVRIAAPAGRFYVYVAWVRHPEGAHDVRLRIGGVEAWVDQSRLANGSSPDGLARDDMPAYAGLCSSGLFRLTDQPIVLRSGNALEITRSDTGAGRVTTFGYAVFSPYLYLDDLGNDAAFVGQPLINLKDYGPGLSGDVGSGLAFIPSDEAEAAIEWAIPADGLFVLAANPNLGPSRAVTMPLDLTLPDGRTEHLSLAGRAGVFGRAGWQEVGVLRDARGAKLRLRTGEGGVTCADLLRLTPVAERDLAPREAQAFDGFTVQWEAPSRARPWLRDVQVAPSGDDDVLVTPLQPSRGLPNGLRVRVAQRRLPVLGAADGRGLLRPSTGAFRVELAGGYGFSLSGALLRRERFVWLKSLGIFACADGDFASHQAALGAMARQVQAAAREPFRSTSERYYALTGYHEARPGLDDRAFQFAYDPSRPLLPRVGKAIASMPEVTYRYFLSRVEEPKHRRMFLGWPNVCQEFYVLSNGLIGVSSGSGAGTGHPPAEHFTVQLGAGQPAVFHEHGDPSVTQRLEDGYHIIVHSEWRDPGAQVHATAFAYPLAGEDVHTGNEPLAAFVRVRRRSTANAPLWLRLRPEQWGGPSNPLARLSEARVEGGLLLTGPRIVLAVDGGDAVVAAASDQEVLVRLIPRSEHVDLVIPYIAVEPSLVARARQLGFDGALARTKRYWDARLAQGATVEVPDDVVVDQYKTLYPRTLVCGDLDTQGDYALKTSPIVYDLVWLHATAYGIEGLARRGHFTEARQYLEAAFHWQGSHPSDATGFTTWRGFFTAPPRYTALLWLNFHGWMQWAAARYFLYSDDRAWLQQKLPALVDSLEWTASQRKLTMHDGADGPRPPNWGWLPPGRVTDGSAGTSTFTDCINWMGFDELTRVLERVGHPRAAEFRAVADDYRACILRGLRLAAQTREPVRLNDGTYVPYVPGYLESVGHEDRMWYAAVVDGALEGILDSGIIPPGDPMEDWVLGNLEDNLFVMAPNLADEAWYLGHGCAYVRRDEPQQAIYTLYSVLASHMARQTLTTFEHRSWGAGRVYDLSPWPMGHYTRLLAGMLCDDEADELFYGRATPRAWLDPGRAVRVERLQTRFGPTSFFLRANSGRVTGALDLPTRYPPSAIRLRLRVNGTVTGVKLNGRPVPVDTATGTMALPGGVSHIEVEATVARRP